MITDDAIFLDELIDPATLADIEAHVAAAAEKDRNLRKLMKGAPLLQGAITRAVTACLHFDPLAVLADGWCTAKDIRAYGKDAKGPVILKLGSHSISRSITPAITIALGGEKHFQLPLGLELSGAFEGVELAISGGNLVSVGSGECRLSLGIQVAGRSVASKTLKTLHLPGEHRFRPPVPIY